LGAPAAAHHPARDVDKFGERGEPEIVGECFRLDAIFLCLERERKKDIGTRHTLTLKERKGSERKRERERHTHTHTHTCKLS